MEIGERVIAVRDAKNGIANIYGYGAYMGNHQPPGLPIENPKIKLDNGNVVWGYQCWWGKAEKVEKRFEGWEFIEVQVPEENE